uniref:Aamy domain-containing protein n=1 Tax=Macrostomum lignano TaxID=282301 RepID=A0A1I8F541_9PLAT
MADFGYDISNHTDIDPVFGSLTDFDQLVREIHKRSMYLVMDFVPNHTSDRHPWFEASRRDPAGPYGDFYVWTDCRPPTKAGEAPGGVNKLAELLRRQRVAVRPDQGPVLPAPPDLNFRHAGVREAMRSVVRFWLERGVDGFRVDAVKHLFEDPMLRDEPVAAGPEKLTDDPWREGGRPQLPAARFHHRLQRNLRRHGRVAPCTGRVAGATGRRRLLVEAYSDLPALMRYYSWRGKALADFPSTLACSHASGTERGGGGGGGGGSGRFCNAACLRTAAQQFLNAAPEGAWPNWVLGNHDNSRLSTRFPPEGRFVRALKHIAADVAGHADLCCRSRWSTRLAGDSPSRAATPRRPHAVERRPSGRLHRRPLAALAASRVRLRAKCVAAQLRMPNSTLAAFQAVAELRRQREFLDGELRFLMETEAELLAYWRGLGDSGYIVAMYISANTEPLVLDLSASGCRSMSLVADFRAANRNDFSVSGVAMQPGDAIIAKAADCKPDQLELRVFQRSRREEL